MPNVTENIPFCGASGTSVQTYLLSSCPEIELFSHSRIAHTHRVCSILLNNAKSFYQMVVPIYAFTSGT